MKKKILGGIVGIGLICLLAYAVQPTTMAVKYIDQGKYVEFGMGTDSIQVSDTIIYPFSITHINRIAPYVSMKWTKAGTGTATIAVTFDQSNDGTNWYACKYGKVQGAYSKSLTLTASTTNEISFERDSIYFEGRYLRIKYITSATAGVKYKLDGYLKVNIK